MQILVISDLHGALDLVREAVSRYAPDRLLSCGDWGGLAEVHAMDLAALVDRLPVWSTFGNHDPIELLQRTRNRDGTSILMDQGEVRMAARLRIAAIGGIWAKSHRQPYYVTDADVISLADGLAAQGPIDILLTHACPVGLADLTPSGRHGGQRCFLDANKRIAPRVHFCGHLHRSQRRTLRDGRQILNVGATSEGSAVLLNVRDGIFDAQFVCLDT